MIRVLVRPSRLNVYSKKRSTGHLTTRLSLSLYSSVQGNLVGQSRIMSSKRVKALLELPFKDRSSLLMAWMKSEYIRRILSSKNYSSSLMPSLKPQQSLQADRCLGLKEDVGQRLTMPILDEQRCIDLVSRIEGRDLELRDMYAWSESIQDATKKPLFSIMIGSVLRDNPDPFSFNLFN